VQAQEGRGACSERLTVAGAPAVLFSAPEDTTLVATVEARTYSLTPLPGIFDPAATGRLCSG
jgi:hypothetical protein